MNESLLHFLWRFQKFTKSSLQTVNGESLEILFPGHLNSLSGPDFSEAKLYLDQLYWCGAVELHVNASDWFRHAHHTDSSYDNVILHVVWNFDSDVCYPKGTPIPTLELRNYVDEKVVENYNNNFRKKTQFIPCESQLTAFSSSKWLAFQERLFVERMEWRTRTIREALQQSKNDWEAVFFSVLAKGFGLNLNGNSLYAMAQSIPFKCVLQTRTDVLNLEALFMGQAGLLKLPQKGNYHAELYQRYQYLKSKYKLRINPLVKIHFARLRPPNFPTIRLAQLAQVYAKSAALFQAVVQGTSLSNYFELLLINTLIPIRYAYANYCGKGVEDALFEWAASVPAENNRILSQFKALEVPQINAIASQALLHLHKNYFTFTKCLSCQVGYELMKTE